MSLEKLDHVADTHGPSLGWIVTYNYLEECPYLIFSPQVLTYNVLHALSLRGIEAVTSPKGTVLPYVAYIDFPAIKLESIEAAKQVLKILIEHNIAHIMLGKIGTVEEGLFICYSEEE